MRLLLPLTLLLTLASSASAAAPPVSMRSADQLDFLFLGSDRPVLLRLHVRVGDKAYDAPWAEFMDKLFAWFDKDGDGFLSPAEAARVLSAQHLGFLCRGGSFQGAQPVPFADLDTNKDGKVSKAEFRAYYVANYFRPVTFNVQSYRVAFAKQINREVFKRLDKDGDGKLTAAKVAGMYRKLKALDENEDEILTAEELDTVSQNGSNGGQSSSSFPSVDGVQLLVEPDAFPPDNQAKPSLVRSMLAMYDRNQDGKLSRVEIGLPPARFAALDANRDGFLDAKELQAYLDGEPDLVLRLQVTAPRPDKPAIQRVAVADEKALPASLRKGIHQPSPDALSLALGDSRMSLQVIATEQYDLGKACLEQFDQAVGKKASLTRAELVPTVSPIIFFFAQADRDGDGKLTRAELTGWLDLIDGGRDVTLTLMMLDLGRGIFSVLDADGDGRLTLREMKDAWASLKPLAKDGKAVAQADLPRSLRLTVELGNNPMFGGSPRVGPPPLPRRAAAKPPQWFRKMDKNNDGDVSRREWLGTDEEFAAIDVDGDGLISVAEALAFEAKKKKDKE